MMFVRFGVRVPEDVRVKWSSGDFLVIFFIIFFINVYVCVFVYQVRVSFVRGSIVRCGFFFYFFFKSL